MARRDTQIVRLETLESRRVLAALAFQDPVTVSEPEIANPAGLELADVDADGDLDAVSFSSRSNELSWWANHGDGNFARKKVIFTIPEESEVHDLALADINQDGTADLLWIASVSDSHYLRWRNNLGNGEFAAASELPLANESKTLSLADLSGDGMLDVLIAGNQWFENNGSEFVAKELPLNSDIERMSSGDIDGDGDLDLVAISRDAATGQRSISWLQNSEQAFVEQTKTEISTRIHDAKFFDADSDLDLDLLVLAASDDHGELRWYENQGGNLDFANAHSVSQDVGIGKIEIADLDGDGDQDLATATYLRSIVDDKVVWFENLNVGNADERFSAATEVSRGTLLPSGLRAGDIDNDGDQDLVTAALGSNAILWHQNNLTDGTMWRDDLVSDIGATSSSAVKTHDMNGDGRPDLVSLDRLAGFVTIAHATDSGIDKKGIDKQRIVIAESLAIDREVFIDFDQDGDLDVITKVGSSEIVWFENVGGNLRFERHLITRIGGLRGFHVVDFDGDSDLDLLTSSDASPGQIQWWSNQANVFSPHDEFTISEFQISDLAAFDFDEDGDLDLASLENEIDGSRLTAYMMWYENSGANQWTPHIIQNRRSSEMFRLTIRDVNADGRVDMTFTAQRGISPQLRNEYQIAFAIDGGFSSPSRVRSDTLELEPADLLPNGPIELVGGIDFGIEIFSNDSPFTFTSLMVVPSETPIASASAADFDGDGLVDLVASTEQGALQIHFAIPAKSGDFNEDGITNVLDLDLICDASRDFSPQSGSEVFDFNEDGVETADDLANYLNLVFMAQAGDSNYDGIFNSSDLVVVFQTGHYENAADPDALWSEGDWNCDGRFDTQDLVVAFQAGTFVPTARPNLASAIQDTLQLNERRTRIYR